jgi:hypothetical protein
MSLTSASSPGHAAMAALTGFMSAELQLRFRDFLIIPGHVMRLADAWIMVQIRQ